MLPLHQDRHTRHIRLHQARAVVGECRRVRASCLVRASCCFQISRTPLLLLSSVHVPPHTPMASSWLPSQCGSCRMSEHPQARIAPSSPRKRPNRRMCRYQSWRGSRLHVKQHQRRQLVKSRYRFGWLRCCSQQLHQCSQERSTER